MDPGIRDGMPKENPGTIRNDVTQKPGSHDLTLIA